MAKPAKTRMCLMCRENFAKDELLRFVVDPNNQLLLDIYAKAPARGEYVCYNDACIDKAVGKKVLAKMLKTDKNQDLAESMLKSLFAKISNLMLMLKKSQMMVLGTENVIELIKSGKADFVLFATDISDNSKNKIDFYIQKSAVKSESLLTKDQLSDMTTLANCSVLAFKKNSLTAQLTQAVKLYKKVLNT
jgi:predicted RNA-binding protein YlxR (DUF448 family)